MDEEQIAAAFLLDVAKQRLQLAAVIEVLLDVYANDAATGRKPTSALSLLYRHGDIVT